MSYINRKGKLFNVSGDGELVKKRSDGRMKTYRSATDARAWCNDSEERRQYILECVSRREQGKVSSLIYHLSKIIIIIDDCRACR